MVKDNTFDISSHSVDTSDIPYISILHGLLPISPQESAR